MHMEKYVFVTMCTCNFYVLKVLGSIKSSDNNIGSATRKRLGTPALEMRGERARKHRLFCDLPLADMWGMRMCLEEMNCNTCSTFFLLSSLSCGATYTPSSTSPAANLNEI